MRPVLSCVFVGGTGLLHHAVAATLARGHKVLAIVGQDAEARAAAGPDAGALPVFGSVTAARRAIAQTPDVLFSIVNPALLGAAELSWPRLLAVNFHDAPLPRHAGVNATAWAIFNGEETHGISWHRMTSRPDAGDILVQRVFDLAPDETALSLNLKCYEQGCASFLDLLAGIETGNIRGTPQDLGRRTLHRRDDRLPDNGILRVDQPAEILCRTVRAGQHGPYANAFGLAKLLLPAGRLAVVGEARPCPGPPAAPGTVLSAGPGRITVAVADGAVALDALRGLDGLPLHALPCAEGDVLPVLCAWDRAVIDRAEHAAARVEEDWVAELRTLLPPLRPAECRPQGAVLGAAQDHRISIDLPPDLPLPDAMARAVLILARRAGRTAFSVGVMRAAPIGFAPMVPVDVRLGAAAAPACTRIIRDAVAAACARPPFPRDLPLRFPALRGVSGQLRQIAIAVARESAADDPGAWCNPGLRIGGAGQVLSLAFAADMFEAEAAANLAEAIRAGLSDLDMVTPPAPVPCQPPLVHHMVAQVAASAGACVAIEWGRTTLGYTALEAQANRLAWLLQQRGAGPEMLIGVLVPRSAEFVVALLGILKSGAAFVPLDPAMPAPRLAEIVEDAAPLLLVCVGASRALAAGLGVAVVDLDDLPDPACAPAPPAPLSPPALTDRSLAYVLYTSGSTGRPKGSMIEHGAFAQFLRANRAQHALCRDDRLLQLCSTAFDAALEEIFGTLCSGGTVVLRPDDLLVSPGRFLDFCTERRLTVIGIFAAMLGDVVAEMERRGSFPETVRLVTTGGERVSPADIHRWHAFFARAPGSGPRLVNVYGLTETTIANLTCDLSGLAPGAEEVPIGTPLAGNLVRVVDAALTPLPGRATGELLIGGRQLARAYLNRTDLTAAKFVTDPEDGSRWFRTGDRVRRAGDGQLIFLGRLDRQVKLRGYRVEPAEIEAALSQHPAVAQACVLCRTDDMDKPRLLAFWVGREDSVADPSADAFRSFLADRLPQVMVPAAFHRLAAFPLTRNGKVDREALQRAGGAGAGAVPGGTGPRSFIEGAVLALFRDALGRADIGIDDNFFDMGGDSLSAMGLVLGLESVTGQTLPIGDLFATPTVRDLAARLQGAAPADLDGRCVVALQRQGKSVPLFLVHGLGGDVFGFLPLAAALGDDRPVFGVQAVGSLPGSVQEMARHYATQIRAVRAQGPYHLAGFSAGGWFAYALAAELARQGQRVGMVCMIDTYPTALGPFWPVMLGRARRVGTVMSQGGPGAVLRAGARGVARLAARLAAAQGMIRAAGAHEGRNDVAHHRSGALAQSEPFRQLVLTYRPPRTRLHVDLISTPASVGGKLQFLRYYARAGVRVHPLFETHLDFLQRWAAPVLADTLRAALHRAEARADRE